MTPPPTKAPGGAATLAAVAIVFALAGQLQLAGGATPSLFGLLLIVIGAVCLAAAERIER